MAPRMVPLSYFKKCVELYRSIPTNVTKPVNIIPAISLIFFVVVAGAGMCADFYNKQILMDQVTRRKTST